MTNAATTTYEVVVHAGYRHGRRTGYRLAHAERLGEARLAYRGQDRAEAFAAADDFGGTVWAEGSDGQWALATE